MLTFTAKLGSKKDIERWHSCGWERAGRRGLWEGGLRLRGGWLADNTEDDTVEVPIKQLSPILQ